MQNILLFELTIISNLPIEPFLAPSINHIFERNGISIRTTYVNFAECSSAKALKVFEKSDFIVIIMNFETAHPCLLEGDPTNNADTIIDLELEKAHYLWKIVRSNANTSVIWFEYEDFQWMTPQFVGSQHSLSGLIDKINIRIREEFNSRIVFIDTKHLIASIGISNAYCTKNKYRWNYPYSQLLSEKIGQEIYKQYLIAKGITKKCLILDCDNVLWGGILSEDGIKSLKLSGTGIGRFYQDFQQFVLSMYYHGVILSICSKNDLQDVLTVFREHSEMILKEEHIACFQVNWEDKPSNIERIAEMLNIGLDSMVFVDDSSDEIDAVKKQLPEVTTVRFHREIDYMQFSCFNLKSIIKFEDIEKRTETFRTNAKREDLKNQSGGYDEFIKALNVNTKIHRIVPTEYSRISELTQRTNKCTNGRRFEVQEIQNCIENNQAVFYSVHVSDRFSDFGLVGAFAVKENRLEMFSLSCRALGYDIEQTMLEYIFSKWKIEKVFFCSTGKNNSLKNKFVEKFHPIFFE